RFRLPSGELVTATATAEHPFHLPEHGAYIDLEALEEGAEVGLAGPRAAAHPRLNGTSLPPIPPRTGGLGAADSRSAWDDPGNLPLTGGWAGWDSRSEGDGLAPRFTPQVHIATRSGAPSARVTTVSPTPLLRHPHQAAARADL